MQSGARRVGAEPERRQATILSCDLTDGSANSAGLDPDTRRDVLRGFREAARAVIHRHEGFIANWTGDGVLVFFAYPRAHDDDPERAVRAGLELMRTMSRLGGSSGLGVRVGVATGLVGMGNPTMGDASYDEAVAGHVANLATRLQGSAAPGSVVISSVTHRLIRERFDCVPLGPIERSGAVEPLLGFRVTAERPQHIRLSTRAQGSPVFGRERDLELLRRRWNAARAGQGQFVLLRGEPGVGKSRLILSLRRELASESLVTLAFFCRARFQHTALHPLIHHLERTAGLGPEGSGAGQAWLERLRAFLAALLPAPRVPEATRRIAALLGTPDEGRYPAILESPERQKQELFGSLMEQLTAITENTPVLIVVEDLQWADPTSLQLLGQVMLGAARLRLLVIATARPGFHTPWPRAAHENTLEVTRLGVDGASRIIDHITQGKRMPDEVRTEILAKGGGVPLLVEEFTKAVLESGLLDERPTSYALACALQPFSVPSTLHDSLLARLDRVSSSRDVAQVAAALGRAFSHDLLAEVMRLPEQQLRAALRGLSEAELIYALDPVKGTYVFRHALLQDAAYSTVPRSTRPRLHRRIAETIEHHFPEVASAELENLAHHWLQAGELGHAITYLQQAGGRALRRAANGEAEHHFQHALELTARIASERERAPIELSVLVQLGLTLSASCGDAAPEVETVYRRALALSRTLSGDAADQFLILLSLATFSLVRADLDAAQELCEQCVRIGERTQRVEHRIDACNLLGYTLVYRGQLEAGDRLLEQALELYESEAGETLVYYSPHDPAVSALGMRAILALLGGDPARADQYRDESLSLAMRTGHPFNVAYARCVAAMLENLRHEYAEAEMHAAESQRISQQHGFDVWLCASTMFRAVAVGGLGAPHEAVVSLREMTELWRDVGPTVQLSWFLTGFAMCQEAAGERDQALGTIDRALQHAEEHGERFLEAEMRRLRAELWQRAGLAKDVQGELLAAAELARSQHAALFELRALTSLAACLPPNSDQAAAVLARQRELRVQKTERRSGIVRLRPPRAPEPSLTQSAVRPRH